jgi:hypothetical protein
VHDDSTDPIEKLLEDVHEIDKSLWADAAPSTLRKEEQQWLMPERMRALTGGLVLLCQLGRYPLWHAHEFTRQQLLGRFEP